MEQQYARRNHPSGFLKIGAFLFSPPEGGVKVRSFSSALNKLKALSKDRTFSFFTPLQGANKYAYEFNTLGGMVLGL